jgi:hypothetical protein
MADLFLLKIVGSLQVAASWILGVSLRVASDLYVIVLVV